MGWPARCSATVYRPRRPRASPLWRLLDRHFDEFRLAYDHRYQPKYGFWRPVIERSVRKFLACGDLREGFARVRCPRCRHEFLVAFSCRRRCLCPSCHQKRALLVAEHIASDVCDPVPHRQFVLTVPKRLRLFFRFDRRLLGELPRLAWQTVLEVSHALLDRTDATPGMIAAIHTFGELVHWHPHVHALVTDGAWTPDGVFLPLPPLESEPFERLWQRKVFELLLEHGKVHESVVHQMLAWRHSGFSVHLAVRLDADDLAGRERLARYMLRCPFSLQRLIRVTPQGKVLYLAEKQACRRFPKPASADLFGAVARNFQIFDPLDFIAELTQHVPETRRHLTRYFGRYSSKARGLRAMADQPGGTVVHIDDEHTPCPRLARRRWAALVKRVWAVDPLICPRCRGPMTIVSFIQPAQSHVIEKILRHRGLWDHSTRAPPPDELDTPGRDDLRELTFLTDPEFVDEPAPDEPLWRGD